MERYRRVDRATVHGAVRAQAATPSAVAVRSEGAASPTASWTRGPTGWPRPCGAGASAPSADRRCAWRARPIDRGAPGRCSRRAPRTCRWTRTIRPTASRTCSPTPGAALLPTGARCGRARPVHGPLGSAGTLAECPEGDPGRPTVRGDRAGGPLRLRHLHVRLDRAAQGRDRPRSAAWSTSQQASRTMMAWADDVVAQYARRLRHPRLGALPPLVPAARVIVTPRTSPPTAAPARRTGHDGVNGPRGRAVIAAAALGTTAGRRRPARRGCASSCSPARRCPPPRARWLERSPRRR